MDHAQMEIKVCTEALRSAGSFTEFVRYSIVEIYPRLPYGKRAHFLVILSLLPHYLLAMAVYFYVFYRLHRNRADYSLLQLSLLCVDVLFAVTCLLVLAPDAHVFHWAHYPYIRVSVGFHSLLMFGSSGATAINGMTIPLLILCCLDRIQAMNDPTAYRILNKRRRCIRFNCISASVALTVWIYGFWEPLQLWWAMFSVQIQQYIISGGSEEDLFDKFIGGNNRRNFSSLCHDVTELSEEQGTNDTIVVLKRTNIFHQILYQDGADADPRISGFCCSGKPVSSGSNHRRYANAMVGFQIILFPLSLYVSKLYVKIKMDQRTNRVVPIIKTDDSDRPPTLAKKASSCNDEPKKLAGDTMKANESNKRQQSIKSNQRNESIEQKQINQTNTGRSKGELNETKRMDGDNPVGKEAKEIRNDKPPKEGTKAETSFSEGRRMRFGGNQETRKNIIAHPENLSSHEKAVALSIVAESIMVSLKYFCAILGFGTHTEGPALVAFCAVIFTAEIAVSSLMLVVQAGSFQKEFLAVLRPWPPLKYLDQDTSGLRQVLVLALTAYTLTAFNTILFVFALA